MRRDVVLIHLSSLATRYPRRSLLQGIAGLGLGANLGGSHPAAARKKKCKHGKRRCAGRCIPRHNVAPIRTVRRRNFASMASAAICRVPPMRSVRQIRSAGASSAWRREERVPAMAIVPIIKSAATGSASAVGCAS